MFVRDGLLSVLLLSNSIPGIISRLAQIFPALGMCKLWDLPYVSGQYGINYFLGITHNTQVLLMTAFNSVEISLEI